MRVLGIDPGLALTGYGCLECDDSGLRSPEVVEAGCLRFKSRQSVSARLVELERDLQELLERVAPECVCVEAVFSHASHPRTAITMAHARGVILLVVRRRGLGLLELSPASVKKAVTGNGRASKPQMQRAMAAVLGLAALPTPADVADALAVAICGARRWAAAGVNDGIVREPERSGRISLNLETAAPLVRGA